MPSSIDQSLVRQWDEYQKKLDAQMAAVRAGLVDAVSHAAFAARKDLIAAEKSIFKAPVPFTVNEKGYKVTPAKIKGD